MPKNTPEHPAPPREAAPEGPRVFRVLVVEHPDPGYGVGAKVPEIPDCEVWADCTEGLIERIDEEVYIHFWTRMKETGEPIPDYRVRIEEVTLEEFGTPCFEQEGYFGDDD